MDFFPNLYHVHTCKWSWWRSFCFFLSFSSQFIEGFNCNNFPSKDIIPSTPATPITDVPAITKPLSSGMPVAEFPLSLNSSASLHSISIIGLLFLSILMAAGLSWSCLLCIHSEFVLFMSVKCCCVCSSCPCYPQTWCLLWLPIEKEKSGQDSCGNSICVPSI